MRRDPGPSWRERVRPHAAEIEPPDEDDVAMPPEEASVTLRTLPSLPEATKRADAPASMNAEALPARRADTDATRLGKAVHRVLEWAAASTADVNAGQAPIDLDDLARAAAA